ncbi:hypothetical protein EJ04DRAFT_553973 [Polyplosphaeria fusca]|uniref:Uncharacterized protein n=1 Tax=Polyplosphaeria fusca TaxID=682080 RepID=A0A9P4QX25_9PLEO|nr:hypothetical protein EJ04DRAFT_553973 [Polyplosphaeria fusca]
MSASNPTDMPASSALSTLGRILNALEGKCTKEELRETLETLNKVTHVVTKYLMDLDSHIKARNEPAFVNTCSEFDKKLVYVCQMLHLLCEPLNPPEKDAVRREIHWPFDALGNLGKFICSINAELPPAVKELKEHLEEIWKLLAIGADRVPQENEGGAMLNTNPAPLTFQPWSGLRRNSRPEP